ncbi:MAG: DUF3488 domain-containing protein [Phycisphaeraceae bacterium]|nr:DUF3488 domain-containing protein [Phycisphaeraceae bacterium]MCW5755461.1 DUF3488 domain-containing protein [Phycisphaeraceae bacterium]
MNPRRLPVTVCRLVLLGIVLYCAADEQWGMLVLAGPLVLIGWRMTSGPRPRGLPGWAVALLVLAFLANAARSAMGDMAVASAFCQFIIFVLIVKFFEKREARDYAQMLMLSAFLCIGALLLSPRLLVGVLLAAFLPMLVYAVMQFQFFVAEGAWRASHDKAHQLGGAKAAVAPRSGDRPGPRLAGVFALIFIVGGASASLVFVIVPRGVGQEVLFGRWMGYPSGAVTGFTDRVRLGEGGMISQSSAVVFDVAMYDAENKPVGSPNQMYYLRGAVLEDYRDQQWQRAARARSSGRQPLIEGRPYRFGGQIERGQPLLQVYTMRSSPGDWIYLFSVWKPVSIRSMVRAANIEVEPQTGTIRVEAPSGRFKYEVQSELPGFAYPRATPERPAEASQDDDDPDWLVRTRMPDAEAEEEPVRPRRTRRGIRGFGEGPIADLARVVLAEDAIEPDPLVRPIDQDARAARIIERWLRENCSYTLDLQRSAPGEDPIEWFLRPENRSGHCEYFASAMTAMCRSVGVNARVVAGYLAAEWSAQTMSYTVRESNAHAWVEVEVAPGVWRTFDPTPPGDLVGIHQARPGLFDRISRFFDSIEYLWISSIVGFDEETRLRLMGAQPGERQFRSREFRPVDGRRVLTGLVQSLMIGAAAFAAAFFAGRAGLAAWRRYRARKRFEAADPALARLLRQAGFYGQLLEELDRRGHGKPSWRPPALHAEAIEATDRSLAECVRRIAAMYYIIRFDRRPLTAGEQARLDDDVATLRAMPRR